MCYSQLKNVCLCIEKNCIRVWVCIYVGTYVYAHSSICCCDIAQPLIVPRCPSSCPHSPTFTYPLTHHYHINHRLRRQIILMQFNDSPVIAFDCWWDEEGFFSTWAKKNITICDCFLPKNLFSPWIDIRNNVIWVHFRGTWKIFRRIYDG